VELARACGRTGFVTLDIGAWAYNMKELYRAAATRAQRAALIGSDEVAQQEAAFAIGAALYAAHTRNGSIDLARVLGLG